MNRDEAPCCGTASEYPVFISKNGHSKFDTKIARDMFDRQCDLNEEINRSTLAAEKAREKLHAICDLQRALRTIRTRAHDEAVELCVNYLKG